MNLTWDEEVILVGNSGFIEDELGQQIPQISERTVSCCRLPVSGAEFYKAGQNGIEISEMLTVHPYEYGGENIVIFQGRENFGCFGYIGKIWKNVSFLVRRK